MNTEGTIYTPDELEYFELIKWTIDYTENIRKNGNDADRRAADNYLKEYHDTEAKIRSFAKIRTEHLRELEKDENRHKDEYHDVICQKCKSSFALKPVGEQKNKQGYMCNTFLCPHCKENFCNWIPISNKGKIELGVLVMEDMKKNHEPEHKIIKLKKTNDDLKEAMKASDETNKIRENAAKDVEKIVKEQVVHLIAYRHKILNGNKPMELN
jgi:hypothetical protein